MGHVAGLQRDPGGAARDCGRVQGHVDAQEGPVDGSPHCGPEIHCDQGRRDESVWKEGWSTSDVSVRADAKKDKCSLSHHRVEKESSS